VIAGVRVPRIVSSDPDNGPEVLFGVDSPWALPYGPGGDSPVVRLSLGDFGERRKAESAPGCFFLQGLSPSRASAGYLPSE
jgi:hypothetical protein